jgi:hypothetical protein
MQFQMSYHIGKKYSSIYEAFFKHFQSVSEELMKHLKNPLDTKVQFQMIYVSKKYSIIYEAFFHKCLSIYN